MTVPLIFTKICNYIHALHKPGYIWKIFKHAQRDRFLVDTAYIRAPLVYAMSFPFHKIWLPWQGTLNPPCQKCFMHLLTLKPWL